MLSRSNPNLTPSLRQSKTTVVKSVSRISCQQKSHVNEKGDAGAVSPGSFELCRDAPRSQSNVRRQNSTPSLPTFPKPATPPGKEVKKALRPASAMPIISQNKPEIFQATKSSSLDSTSSTEFSSNTEQPICEALEKDPKLKALCISLGIDQRPSTLVGPIEKGQLIIGTLQDSLRTLIRLKIKRAERKGEQFHIQQSGLDIAVRALKNAERSLKTIKESKQPVLGRARQQRSSESLVRFHRNQTESVIRILSNTKEKFDRMENGANRFLSGVSLVSAFSSTPPSSTGFSGYVTRRPSGTSVLTTPITPFSASTTTAACSRARTATSSTSVGTGFKGGSRGKLVSIM